MIEARFRYRANSSESAEERHELVVKKLSEIDWLWASNPVGVTLSSSGESASCSLSPFLKKGVRGGISYAARFIGGASDKAIFDDVLTLEIDESSIHYADFAGRIFERIVDAFNAYRASTILDLDLDLDDYEAIVEEAQESGKDVDGRDTVFRIHTVNFFDSELCSRAFGLEPEDVFSRLNGEIERVSVQGKGVLVIATTDLVDAENLIAINEHIMSLL